MSTANLGEAPWLRSPGVVAVMTALHAGEAEDTVVARFVGGAVRDSLLGRPVHDMDIATSLAPETVMERIAAAGLRAVPTGLAHGTVTAIADGRPFEITTLRRDVETDGRHAVVAFTDDWAEDAARRDFTMNAIYADRHGNLFDPFDGVADANAGRVRFIGDAKTRISEDALRILRFFRFHAWYGVGELDQAGLEACAERVADLKRLSVERVAYELVRLLGAPDPVPVLDVMAARGILAQVLPEAIGTERLSNLVALENTLGLVDPIRRLSALLPDGAGNAGARLKLSLAEQQRIEEMTMPREDIAPAQDGAAFGRRLRSICYGIGHEAFLDHVILNWAGRGLASPRDYGFRRWQELYESARNWQRPEFPVKGKDVLLLGLKPGPKVGDILEELEGWWITKDFKPGRDDLLARLSRQVIRYLD